MTTPPLFLQSTAAECGFTCLRMVAAAYGLPAQDAARLRLLSPRGANLKQIMAVAQQMGMDTRPLRLELDELGQLQLPCILHWDLNHFVVLASVRRGKALILDPAVGRRRMGMQEVSRHFTGVALELRPQLQFEPQQPPRRLALSALTGRVQGLKRSLTQILLVALVLQVFAIAAPLANQAVVDQVLTSGDRELLNVVVLGFALLMLTQVALGLCRSWMVMVLGQSVSLQWAGNVFAHLLRLPLRYFEQRHLGDISSRFAAVGAMQHTLTTAVIEAVLDGVLAAATLGMMLLYAPQLAAVVLAAVAAYGLLRWALYSPLRDASAERLVLAAKESSYFLETLRGMLPLKLFGREDERRARWQNLLVDVQNRDVRSARLGIAFSTANAFIFGAENLLVLWLGAQLIMGGQQLASGVTGVAGGGFTIGMLMAFLSYKSQFTGRVSALIDQAVQFKMLSLHQERLADIVLEPPEVDAQALHELKHLSPTLELRGVSFRYGSDEPWVVHEASFKVDAGQCVALVGPSGAGKTTLLKLMLGILRPEQGEVLYGGVPIRQLGVANVRRQIGTVMQDDALLSGSIADNISFFDLQPDLQRIEACAHVAGIRDDIARMPMGLHTLVGDLGSGLSGGQKQRILLARALYKRPRLLALDEATSHLDVALESQLTHRLTQMRLTRLMIAHRPQTIASAQRVLLLQGGRVQELVPQAACKPG